MFKSKFGIFECDNAYECVESIILSSISLFTLAIFLKAYKVISNDNAQVLDRMDKTIFYLSFAHIGILSFNLFFYTSPFFTYTIRTVSLFQEIVICTVVAYIFFPEKAYSTLHRAMQFGLIFAVCLWFFAAMDKSENEPNNECVKGRLLVFSWSSLFVCTALFIFGYGSVRIIINEMERRMSESSNDERQLWQELRYQELKKRKIQLIILVSVNLLATVVQVIWDMKKYNPTYDQQQCDYYTLSHGFFNMIGFLIVKSICYFLPTWGIYYLYYWQNRHNFQTEEGCEKLVELREDLLQSE